MAHDRRHIILASNRGPVGFRIGDRGTVIARRGGGGLITALGGLARHHDVTWIAHAMADGDVQMSREAGNTGIQEVARDGAGYTLHFVGEPDAQYAMFYNTLSNPLLWFVQHGLYGFGWNPTVDRRTHAAFRAYRAINELVAQRIVNVYDSTGGASHDTVIMVQDYHLYLVPGIVRTLRPDSLLQFFVHIPWPAPGSWRCIPRDWVRQFVLSLLACDIVGVQTESDVLGFLQCCLEFVPEAAVDFDAHLVTIDERTVHVKGYPISVAVDEFEEHMQSAAVQRYRGNIGRMRPVGDGMGDEDGTLIVRIDRTDPSKNIVRGFGAFALMLHEHPELHGKVTMFCQLDPSRQDIPEYVAYLADIQRAAESVNVQYATNTWQPLVLNLDANFQAAVAAYCEYDVLFVNPVADGMNLVSKEGPAVNQRNGVVILSEQAGAYAQLHDHVIGVNPFDIADQADALYEAVMCDSKTRATRAKALHDQVVEYDIRRWIDEQLRDITTLRSGTAV